MSFLIDPPLLFLFGVLIYFVGKRLEWNRHAKIVVGIAIVLLFIVFSSLLYTDVFRCVFPLVCNGMTGSEFMFHTNFTGITKDDVPFIISIVMFLLYPFWILFGYASMLLISKRRRYSKETYSYEDVKSQIPKPPSKFAVVRDPEPVKCVREAVSSLGGMQNFVKEGDRVLIKVNICGGVPEIKGTFTSTEVAGEVVDLVRGAGGEPIIADADMIWTKFWPAASDEGWVKWAKEKGVELVNLSETRIVNFDFGENSALGLERVSKEMIDADVIISIPAMKTHLLTGVTLGMKNMYGTFPEVDKARYHRKKIEDVIYEVNKAFTPNLVIIDGSIGGETVGPLSCDPVNFQTVIASNDVVTADAVACQLMGYDPIKDVTHIRMAHEKGLGDASQKYDLVNLPYDHIEGKDGNWERPDPEVKDFYEWGIEFLLKFPGWETLFNIGSDFFLYDLARLPILKYFTPAVLQMLNDISRIILKGEKPTKESKRRRTTNLFIVLFISLASIFGFYVGGFYARSSLFFNLNYLLIIALSIWIVTKMKTKHLIALVVSSGIVTSMVEFINPSAGMWEYEGAIPPLFAVFGTPLLMIAIFGFSIFLEPWLSRLGLFRKIGDGILQRNLPFLAVVIIFTLFLGWEGYFKVADMNVLLLYLAMGLVGLVYTSRHSIEWNTSLMVVSVVLGGSMEFMGSLDGMWRYHYMEALPIFLIVSWAINSWTIHGLASLINIDIARSMDLERGE